MRHGGSEELHGVGSETMVRFDGKDDDVEEEEKKKKSMELKLTAKSLHLGFFILFFRFRFLNRVYV